MDWVRPLNQRLPPLSHSIGKTESLHQRLSHWVWPLSHSLRPLNQSLRRLNGSING